MSNLKQAGISSFLQLLQSLDYFLVVQNFDFRLLLLCQVHVRADGDEQRVLVGVSVENHSLVTEKNKHALSILHHVVVVRNLRNVLLSDWREFAASDEHLFATTSCWNFI